MGKKLVDEEDSTKLMREIISIREELNFERLSFQNWFRLESRERILMTILMRRLHDEMIDKLQ
tara:strand:+ start:1602 stop:1790 length:189 start_codon:yes stop_codon:yes gene_type:complete